MKRLNSDQGVGRRCLVGTICSIAAVWLGGQFCGAVAHIATFSADITTPVGSPLCGGLVAPASAIDDPQRALGVVLLGGEKPIVLCAVDWVAIYNATYDESRPTLAAAAGTDPSHVAVQTVHQHDTHLADLEAHAIAQEVDPALRVVDPGACRAAMQATAAALKASLAKSQPFTHIGTGQARVEQVASTRRILGADGKVQFVATAAVRRMKSAGDIRRGRSIPF